MGAKGLEDVGFRLQGLRITCSLHRSSFLGLPYRIHIIYLVKPKEGTTMETIGRVTIRGGYGVPAFRASGLEEF